MLPLFIEEQYKVFQEKFGTDASLFLTYSPSNKAAGENFLTSLYLSKLAAEILHLHF